MSDSFLKNIPIENIFPDPDQPRELPDSFTELKLQKESGDRRAVLIWDKLRELATSILETGLEQPVTVYKGSKDDHYIIYDGHRRWLAMSMLHASGEGDGTVLCHIRSNPQSDGDTLLGQITVNVQRDELNVFELARGLNQIYQQLKKEGGEISFVEDDGQIVKQEIPPNSSDDVIWDTIERKVGIGRSRRYQIQAVLKLPKEVQKIAEEAAVSENTLRLIIPIKDQSVQMKVVRELVKKDLSPAEIKQLTDRLQRKKEETSLMPKPRRIISSIKHIQALTEDIGAVSDISTVVNSKDPRTVASYKETIPQLQAAKKNIERILEELSFLED